MDTYRTYKLDSIRYYKDAHLDLQFGYSITESGTTFSLEHDYERLNIQEVKKIKKGYINKLGFKPKLNETIDHLGNGCEKVILFNSTYLHYENSNLVLVFDGNLLNGYYYYQRF